MDDQSKSDFKNCYMTTIINFLVGQSARLVLQYTNTWPTVYNVVVYHMRGDRDRKLLRD